MKVQNLFVFRRKLFEKKKVASFPDAPDHDKINENEAKIGFSVHSGKEKGGCFVLWMKEKTKSGRTSRNGVTI